MAQPRTSRAVSGEAAEDVALAQLRSAGLELLARNVRYPFGELDLVMREGATLVFVEVRLRRGDGFGGAAASVDRNKRRKLARAAQAWLVQHRQFAHAPCRFDVVALGAGQDAQVPRRAGRPGAAAAHCDWLRAAFTLDDLW